MRMSSSIKCYITSYHIQKIKPICKEVREANLNYLLYYTKYRVPSPLQRELIHPSLHAPFISPPEPTPSAPHHY